MTKEQALKKVAAEIIRCPLCKQDGTGKAVPGEGNPDARVLFIGEAPGKEEAKVGRPFIGRSGKFLRQAMKDIGLEDSDVFITSPGHYLPLRGKPSEKTVVHGRTHLFKQIEIIDPLIIVLMGATACFGVLDRKVEVVREHGSVIALHGRDHLITFHPAYAMRFPPGKEHFFKDFQKLKRLLRTKSR